MFLISISTQTKNDWKFKKPLKMELMYKSAPLYLKVTKKLYIGLFTTYHKSIHPPKEKINHSTNLHISLTPTPPWMKNQTTRKTRTRSKNINTQTTNHPQTTLSNPHQKSKALDLVVNS